MSNIDKLTLKERNRRKVQVGMIINRLHKCVQGTIKMTATQVNAARILLAKAVPDLRSVEVTGTIEYDGNPDSITNQQLATIIATAGSSDVVTAPKGKTTRH